jgi:hypothetical protein
VNVLETVAERAAEASPLWASALLGEPRGGLRFAARCPERHLLGVETIYEGYLLHHGTSTRTTATWPSSPATISTRPAYGRSARRATWRRSTRWPS